MMFDNNFNSTIEGGEFNFVDGGPSRLLIVKVDEIAGTATLAWEVTQVLLLRIANRTAVRGGGVGGVGELASHTRAAAVSRRAKRR